MDKELKKSRNTMKIKEFVLLLSTLLIINCAGTAPSVGEEMSSQESTESDTRAVSYTHLTLPTKA